MHHEIKRRLEQQLAAARRVSIRRGSANDGVNYISNLASHAKETLALLVPPGGDTPLVAREVNPAHRAQVLRLLDDWSSTGLGGSARKFDLTVPTGNTVLAPPYDKEWGEGLGFGFGATADGKFLLFNPEPNTTSGAGIGIFLNVTSDSLVSVIPQGTYEWAWLTTEDIPGGWTKGGLAATVYQDANPAPIFSELATLWSAGNISTPSGFPLNGQSGSGTLADAVVAGPSGIFGTQLYAPITLSLQPGSNYLVWIWAWALGNVPDGLPFVAVMSVSVPMISLSASPPPVIG
jgi:hypothetical protein